MKNIILSSFLMCFSFIISSCTFDSSTDLAEVKDSLGYKQLLGTYVFKPSAEQAERLNINSNQLVTLKITIYSASERYAGKYYIDKMILMWNSPSIDAYSSTWQYHYSSNMKINTLELSQPYKTSNDMDYRIERSINSDTLHITGYIDDPKYEFMRLVDFKKIK